MGFPSVSLQSRASQRSCWHYRSIIPLSAAAAQKHHDSDVRIVVLAVAPRAQRSQVHQSSRALDPVVGIEAGGHYVSVRVQFSSICRRCERNLLRLPRDNRKRLRRIELIGRAIERDRFSTPSTELDRFLALSTELDRFSVLQAELGQFAIRSIGLNRFLVPGIDGKRGWMFCMNRDIGEPSIPLPSFPDRTVSICDHGAVPGGLVDNTLAIAGAISACSQAGGGRVVIPRGIWLTGPIHLQSNTDLHAEEGALVLFRTRYSDYPLRETNFEGVDRIRCTSPLNGHGLENIAITGRGTFDGSGHVWRPVKRSKMTAGQWRALVSSGGVVDDEEGIWWPADQASLGEALIRQLERDGKPASAKECAKAAGSLRPVLLSLVNCRRVLLDGPTFQNSPAWALHPLLCEDVTVRNIFVKNEWYAQNGDGLDLDSCRNAGVTGSVFDVGDDAICLKSGRDEAGRRRSRPCSDIWIDNCTVYRGHGGFTVGSEMSGGVCNVRVSDCTFIDTDVGLRFKSNRGRGGVVENIRIERVNMVRIAGDAISFDLWYGLGRKDAQASRPLPVSEETPIFRDISIRDVVCRGASRAIAVRGLPEMPVQRLSLENVSISSRKGAQFIYADTVEMKRCEIIAEDGPAITAKDGTSIVTD